VGRQKEKMKMFFKASGGSIFFGFPVSLIKSISYKKMVLILRTFLKSELSEAPEKFFFLCPSHLI